MQALIIYEDSQIKHKDKIPSALKKICDIRHKEKFEFVPEVPQVPSVALRCESWFLDIQEGVRSTYPQQKAPLQLLRTHLICGLNVTQFSCCKLSMDFSDSDSSDAVTFQAGADLVTKAAMSNDRLILSQQLAKESALFTFSEVGDNTG